jgi:N6-L-threonylcarbamoyladenine synthase
VTVSPGLISSLLIGLHFAKSLALAWNKPLVGVNHIEAHLYAAMMTAPLVFPAIGLVVSGGHTLLLRIEGIGEYRLIGTTVDDAAGEAFDKVASLLGLPYPGGPAIEELALRGDLSRYRFKPGRVKNRPLDFSFSGLKTQILYALKGQNGNKEALNRLPVSEKAHLAACFQQTALQDLVDKTTKATEHFPSMAIYVGGGVSASQRLRALFQEANLQIPIYFPAKTLSLDNGAMIAGLGHFVAPIGQGLDLTVSPTLPTLHSLQSARQEVVFSRD